MNDQLELAIRKKYSEIHPQLEALVLWVRNTLSELCLHDDHLYNYKIRIKEINSLLKKVDGLIKKGASIDKAADVVNIVNDFVGSRIILFYPSKLLPLHTTLTNFKRAKIIKVTVHYQEGYPDRVIQEIIDDTRKLGIPLKEDINKTGYTGVHYVFEPCPVDEYYKSDEPKIFSKFELQIRTILQEAWSEVQHAIIYKGEERPDYEKIRKQAEFSMLAESFNANDRLLDRLAHPSSLARTHKLKPSERPTQFDPALKEIEDAVKQFEENSLPMSAEDRYQKTDELLLKYHDEILKYSEHFSKDTIIFNLSLAELYLKGGHYKEAYCLYRKIFAFNDKDEWVLLRLAETCDSMAKEEEAVKCINKLKEQLCNRTTHQDNDDVLFSQGAFLAWKYKLLDIAVFLGEQAVNLTSKDAHSLHVRRTLNLLYYQMDFFVEKYNTNPCDLENKLDQMQKNMDEIEISINKSPGIIMANDWDTLAWYYFQLADVRFRNKNPKAVDDIRRSAELIARCFLEWSLHERDNKNPHESWLAHSKRIRVLKETIDEENSKIPHAQKHSTPTVFLKPQKPS